MKKTVALMIITLSVILGFTVFALVKNPPEQQETDEQNSEQTETEGALLEQTFTEIDPSVSKKLVISVEEMSDREPADAIVNSVVQNEGSVGKITADLNKKELTIEYDSSKLKEDELLKSVNAAGYKIQVVPEETPTP